MPMMAEDGDHEATAGPRADKTSEPAESSYQPRDDRGGDTAQGGDHEEPIDGPEPEPENEG